MKELLISLTILLFSCTNSVSNRTNVESNLSDAAISIEDPNIMYVARYVAIPYPNGDVDPKTGVCTDVVIRSYRKIGIDLQRLVHEDMVENFNLYPQNWGLSKPNSNIDHRRVPNLMKFFSRHGESLPITNNPEDYKPGDIVCWELSRGILHIGIVVDEWENGKYKVIHNIGGGQVIEDVLFNYKIIGHYSY